MRHLISVTLLLAANACTCKPNVTQIKPSLGASPVGVDFGQVKTGSAAKATVTLSARSNAPVAISSIKLEAGSAPGGLEAFTLGAGLPTSVDALGSATVELTFTPTVLEAYQVTLVVQSNDAESPTLRVPVVGEGARPIIEVTPECVTTRGCTDQVTVTPPAIDFGLEPFMRASPVDPSKLPTVNVVNSGPVALTVSKLAFEGADATAFSLGGNSTFPPGGLSPLN